MYHRIDGAGCPTPPDRPEERRYAVRLEDFRRQMAGMREAGFRGVSLGAALEGGLPDDGGREIAVVITFDDGNRSDHECALPVLAEHGFSATFFVTGERVGRADGLSAGEIRNLCAAGMEVGSHGMTHRFLSELPAQEQETECRCSRDLLSEAAGRPVRFFSLPGGRSSKATIGILKALSYSAACTSVFGYNRAGADPYRLKRIPVTRATSEREFHGTLRRSPRVVYPAFVASRSRTLARRLLGERLYGGLRGRLVGE